MPQTASSQDEAVRQAAIAIETDRPAEAEKIARDVLSHNAGNVRAMHLLGAALLMQQRASEALEPLERAAKQKRDPAVETHLAIALRQIGRSEDAVVRLQRAIKREPAFPPAFHELATQLTDLGRSDEALEVLEAGAELAPRYAELWVDLGFALSAHRRHARAIAAFEHVLADAPDHIDAQFGLARALQNAGQYERAVTVYRKLLAAQPAHAGASVGLGACLLELGQPAEAFDRLRSASRTGPHMYRQALVATVSSGRGRFWLRPSSAAKALNSD